ncbi:hypothetical protein L0B53_13625 [Vibrio sp. SS-MA-C1-2]|uniref:hypothetical protein n=1 Tax=Vibrio sp. SS-MA-C1-2 TaxID=2908646 RepID=UPI001F3C6569|nr:hypothetical protein [Vibrio sp. SS-MA-C1-2]UJF18056.1 hypothetical protein L0B53_13625 [Vibrio sp. SS-MA-C1-2]
MTTFRYKDRAIISVVDIQNVNSFDVISKSIEIAQELNAELHLAYFPPDKYIDKKALIQWPQLRLFIEENSHKEMNDKGKAAFNDSRFILETFQFAASNVHLMLGSLYDELNQLVHQYEVPLIIAEKGCHRSYILHCNTHEMSEEINADLILI